MSRARQRIVSAHVLLLVLVAGCGVLDKMKGGKGKDSGGADDAGTVATAVEDSGGATADTDSGGATADTDSGGASSSSSSGGTTEPEAANENDVARFPDETKVDNTQATILVPSANIRTAPLSGAIVASLKKGTAVTQIAQRDKNFLVVFPDPKDASRKLEGWVVQDAFKEPVNPDAGATIVTLNCPAGQQLLLSDVAFCGVVCKTQKECPANQDCKGTAQLIAKGKPSQTVSTCVAVHVSKPDAGAPPAVVDAGAPKVDAGAPKVDAGAPAAGGIEVPPGPGNACPVPYVFAPKTGKCHKPCVAGVNPAAVCGAARCTTKCGTAVPICSLTPCN